MKKHLLLIAAISISFMAPAQILNPSFEDTHPNGGPAHWAKILLIQLPCDPGGGFDSTYFQSTDAHTGTYALEMRNAYCDTAFFLAGGVNLMLNDEFYSGFGTPFTQRPDAITMFYKLLPLGGDVGHITIQLTDSTGNSIADADYYVTQPAASYTQLDIPLTYNNADIPVFISMTMGITNQTTHVTYGTRFLVDDVSALATGISETKATALTVFPNPSQGSITIKSKDNEPVQMIIYNAMGQQVKNAKVPVNTQIHMGDLTTGNYFYQIISNTKTAQTGKLMIE